MAYILNTDKSVADTEHDLRETFSKWGIRDYGIEYNVQRSRIMNRTLTQSERGVTVRWMPRAGNEVVLSHDRQGSVASNLRVLYLGIESIRMNERRGIDPELMKSAYLQIDAPSTSWETVLGISRGASREEIEVAYRRKAHEAHPDKGGSDAAMSALTAAYREALRSMTG